MIQIDPKTVTATQLRRAADIIEHIEMLGAKFRQLFRNPYPDEVPKTPVFRNKTLVAGTATPTRRKMSAAARAKISAAAKKRWKQARAAGKNSL
jgi:hypothetical protein